MAIVNNEVLDLIQDGYSTELLNTATASSVVASTARVVNMGTRSTKLPVLATLPVAKWVGSEGESRRKPTSSVGWDHKYLNVEELAVIVPVRQEDLEDASTDLLSDIARLGGQAIGRALDEAVLFGLDKPVNFRSLDLTAAAVAAGNVFQIGTGANDLSGSIFQAAGAVADGGYEPSVFASRSGMKYRLANQRGTDNAPIYFPSLSVGPGAADNVAGLNAAWCLNGAWDSTKAEALVFDPTRVILGIRTDIQVSFSDQATVENLNLWENDMVALRFRARYAYALGDVVQPDGAVTCPVAVITPAATGV